jgi:hypothetical protein
VDRQFRSAVALFQKESRRLNSNLRYREWFVRGGTLSQAPSSQAIKELLSLLILVARDEGRRQLALQLEPLPPQELDQRDSSQVQGAAEIMANEAFGLPYYYGIERLCAMATNNVEELLSLAAALYEGLRAKLVLRRADLILSAFEQEKLLRDAAKRKREFIPKAHTEGTRAAGCWTRSAAYAERRRSSRARPTHPA